MFATVAVKSVYERTEIYIWLKACQLFRYFAGHSWEEYIKKNNKSEPRWFFISRKWSFLLILQFYYELIQLSLGTLTFR